MISVIVPVYNTAQFIRQCVQSVLAQTYTEFELILADDSSQDGSREICQGLCAEDSRIRLLELEHKGVAAARNAAMEAAQGEYFFFLDGDDAIHPRLLEALHTLAEETCAALAAEEYCTVDSEEFAAHISREATAAGSGHSGYLHVRNALENFLCLPQRLGQMHAIGGKLLRRDTVAALRFREGLRRGEDTLFLYEIFARGADAAVLQDHWYYYRRHGNNASGNCSWEAIRDVLAVERYICDGAAARCGVDSAVQWERMIADVVIEQYELGRREKDREMKKSMRRFARAEMQQALFSRLSCRERMRFYLIFHSYPLYCCARMALRYIKKGGNRGGSGNG